jgi:lysozyme
MANDLWDGATVPAAATVVVKRVEGFFPQPYDDNGALPGGTWTIGYGTIRDAAGKAVTPSTPAVTSAALAAFHRASISARSD